MHGEDRRLDAEYEHEDQRGHHHQGRGAQEFYLHGKVRHVHRAHLCVEERDAQQEERRRDQVHAGVLEGHLELVEVVVEAQKRVRGHQHDLEEDEEVEQVARDEAPLHPHQEKMQEGVKSLFSLRIREIAPSEDGARPHDGG